jgi:glutathione-regulated potassium-efflux system ancillary protein KefF
MRFLPPLLLYGAHRASEQAVADHVALFAQRLRSHPQWPELAALERPPAGQIPPTDRPVAPRGRL